MPTFKQIVKSAGGLLLNHPIAEVPAIKSTWKKIECKIMPESGQGHAALEPHSESMLLYPSIQQLPAAQADAEVLRQFGLLLYRNGRDRARQKWEKKLALPEQEQVDVIQRKLNDPLLRKDVHTYEALMQTFKSAVDRLVCLNMTNALLANGVAFGSSQGVNLREWGPTSEYAKLEREHSLLPLISAYAPKEIYADFGWAFAEMVINKMRSVKESSVQKAFERIIRDCARSCEKWA